MRGASGRITVPGVQQVDDRQTQQISQDVATLAGQVAGVPIVQGTLIQGIVATSGYTPFTLTHSLGRAWVGYFLTKSTTYQALWTGAQTGVDVTKQMLIMCLQPGTFDVWVF